MNNIVFPCTYPVTSHTDHVRPGSTFVAVKGMKEDGMRYIDQALAAGATRIVMNEGSELSADLRERIKSNNADLLFVPSTRLALAELSAEAYRYPARSMRIIGITGTKGKTTTAFLVEHVLRAAGYKTALLSTVENRILDQRFDASLTTPQPDYIHSFLDLCRSQGVDYVIMEVAAQALSLHRVATLEFDSVVFTNFSLGHSEFYTSQDDYFNAKCLIFNQCASGARIVLNADDEAVAGLARGYDNVTLFGMKQKAHIACTIEQSDLTALAIEIRSTAATYSVKSPALLGEFSAANILAALAIAEKYGVTPPYVEQALASFSGIPGRLQRFTLPNGAVAFIDTAHTPSSFEALFMAVRPLSKHIVALFGAGGDRDSIKRPLMGALAVRYADCVILTTDNPRSEDPERIIDDIQKGIDEQDRAKVLIEPDREKAMKQAYALSKPGSIILLLGKGPVEYQQVGEEKIPFSEMTILRSF